MSEYRIYAKILGPLLPDKKTSYEDCFIITMSITEQERRKFKPIEANSPKPTDDEYFETYITHLRVIDPRIIKTGHIIYTDVKTHDVSSALGYAIRRFEKITGTLAITASIHYAKKHKIKSRYTNYEYQIVRIYVLVDGNESEAEVPVFAGGTVSLINLPSESDMSVLDEKLLNRMLQSKDDIFWKALSYLQSGEKGFHNNTPPEKITLDFMKSIELIINLWSGKCRKSNKFSNKLKRASNELEIDENDQKDIKKLWEMRSNGDVAHSKRGSKTDYYPAQYPIPSNVDGPYIDSSSLAVRVLTKYFMFRDSILSIKISDDTFDEVDEIIDVNQGTIYSIHPSTKDKKNLTPFLKRKISKHFAVPVKNIKLYTYQLPQIHFRISDHLDYDVVASKISKKKIVISFGNT